MFRYNCIDVFAQALKPAEANMGRYYRESPGWTADASQAVGEAVKELVKMILKREE